LAICFLIFSTKASDCKYFAAEVSQVLYRGNFTRHLGSWLVGMHDEMEWMAAKNILNIFYLKIY
jgi:hypothetical protein